MPNNLNPDTEPGSKTTLYQTVEGGEWLAAPAYTISTILSQTQYLLQLFVQRPQGIPSITQYRQNNVFVDIDG